MVWGRASLVSADQERLWEQQLEQGLQEMAIVLSAGQQQQLLGYLTLLQKWNRRFNLTAVRDPGEMVSRQLLDSLSILKLLRGSRVLDVGSGPGLPGIPLALALPEVHFTLLDSNGKKTRFVEQARMELGLGNVSVVRSRVELFQPPAPFDTITSRAFASLRKMVELTSHLLVDGGCYLAMKGAVPRDEIKAMEEMGGQLTIRSLAVPGTQGERHAVLWEFSRTKWILDNSFSTSENEFPG